MTKPNDTDTKTNHHVHTSHERAKPMKTTKKTHTQIDQTNDEGETTMKTKSETTKTDATETASTTTSTPRSARVAAYVARCSALLAEFEEAFPKGDPLTAKEKKRMTKARKGSERYTPQLVALAKQHGVSISSVPLDAISDASAEAAQLVPLQKQMTRLNARLSIRAFTMQSTSWSGSSKLYSVLKRLSKDDGELADGLAPVEQYFNHRHPLVAAEHPKTDKGKAALKAKKVAATSAVATPDATASVVATPVASEPATQVAATPTEPTTPSATDVAATESTTTHA